MPGPTVRVEGLRELRIDLVRLDRDYFAAAFIAAGLAVANPGASRIAAALPTGPGVKGHLKNTVRPGRVQRGAIVRTGFASKPSAGPVEFGNWPGNRPFIKAGRFIFPAAQSFGDEAQRTYTDEITKTIDRYPWSYRA